MSGRGGDSLRLPSQKIYHRIGQKVAWCQRSGIPKYGQTLKNTIYGAVDVLGIKPGNTLAEEIARGWCSAHIMWQDGQKQSLDYDPWDFFYYWLGDKVKGNLLAGQDFADIMGKIYEKLRRDEKEVKYINKYPDISKDIFERAKKLFDYQYNYSALSGKLDASSDYCNGEFSKYMKGAQDAYGKLVSMCVTNNEGSSYCTKFKAKFQESKISEPTDLICRTVGELKTTVLEATLNPDGGDHGPKGDVGPAEIPGVGGIAGAGTPAAAAASAAGKAGKDAVEASSPQSLSTTIIPPAVVLTALPAVGFFLYKYSNLFSGLRSNSSNRKGRAKNGRKRTIEHEFDTLTEDSSTTGLRTTEDTSTIVDDDGTESDSATLYSVPYTTTTNTSIPSSR